MLRKRRSPIAIAGADIRNTCRCGCRAATKVFRWLDDDCHLPLLTYKVMALKGIHDGGGAADADFRLCWRDCFGIVKPDVNAYSVCNGSRKCLSAQSGQRP